MEESGTQQIASKLVCGVFTRKCLSLFEIQKSVVKYGVSQDFYKPQICVCAWLTKCMYMVTKDYDTLCFIHFVLVLQEVCN